MSGEFLSFSKVYKLRHGSDINQVLATKGRMHESRLAGLLESESGPSSLEKLRLAHFRRGLKLTGVLECGVKVVAKPDFAFFGGWGGVVTSAHFVEVKLRGNRTGSDFLQGMFVLHTAEVDADFGSASCDLTFCHGFNYHTEVLRREEVRHFDEDFKILCLSAAALLGWISDEDKEDDNGVENDLWGRVFAATAPQLPKRQQIENPANRFYKAYEKITSQW